MSLKAFHIFFIALAALMCFFLGAWALNAASAEGASGWLRGFGIGGLVAGAGLVIYGIRFIRKTRNLGYL